MAARATDAKIRLWRIKHRRVQTAAVVLCRGVYVFVGRVEIGLGPGCGCVTGGERNIIHADAGFSCSRVYSREIFPCTRAAALFRASAGLFAGNLSLYPRGGSFPRFRGFIRAFSFPVPARWLFFALPRVYSREIFPCTRASAGFLSLHSTRGTILHIIPNYPRAHYNAGLITSANSAFAAFLKSSGFRVSWTPILPPLTTILSRDAAPASIRVTYCFFMPMAVQPPRT